MSRREQAIAHDPKSEAAAAERDSVLGQKTNLQSEVLQIAATKKRLEGEHAENMKAQDAELEKRRTEVAEEKLRLEGTNDSLKKENSVLEAKNKVLNDENAARVQLGLEVAKTIEKDKEEKIKLESDLKMYGDASEKANKQVAEHSADIVTLEVKKSKLEKVIKDLEAKVLSSDGKHTTLQADIATASETLRIVAESRREHDTALSALKDERDSAQKELSDLQAGILVIRDEMKVHVENKQKMDDDMHEKMGAMSRLKDETAKDFERNIALKQSMGVKKALVDLHK